MRHRSNPVLDNSSKDLYQRFEGLGIYQPDDEIVSDNSETIDVHFDISADNNRGGTKIETVGGAIISRQEQFTRDIYVDGRTGKILGFATDETNLELACWEHSVLLELHALVDHSEFVQDRPGYQLYQFAITGPKDSANREALPLGTLLEPRAAANLHKSVRICNSPNG